MLVLSTEIVIKNPNLVNIIFYLNIKNSLKFLSTANLYVIFFMQLKSTKKVKLKAK
jgi:hypothetical protein